MGIGPLSQNAGKKPTGRVKLDWYALEQKERRDQRKVLLLGTGDCGKTTFWKQIKIREGGFGNPAKTWLKSVITSNIVHGMVALLEAMRELNLEFENAARQSDAATVREKAELPSLSLDILPFDELIRLWGDTRVKEAFEHRDRFHISNSLAHFLNSLERIRAIDYSMSDDDILQAHEPTERRYTARMVLGSIQISIYDVGGRQERRQWTDLFYDLDVAIFITAVSEFDQKLEEDETVNRIDESMNLFKHVNTCFLKIIPMILLFNKLDLFRAKLTGNAFKEAFPHYDGPEGDYRRSLNHIAESFDLLHPIERRQQLYKHETQLTDKNETLSTINEVAYIVRAPRVGPAVGERKILLLGTAESGKSTFLKQFLIYNGRSYAAEASELTSVLSSNLLQGMVRLLNAMRVMNLAFQDAARVSDAATVREKAELPTLSLEILPFDELIRLGADIRVQEAFRHRDRFHISDSFAHFMGSLERIRAPGYTLSNEDLIQLRAPTIGVNLVELGVGDLTFNIYDVGGQRSERRKWVSVFGGMNVTIFIAAVSEFDQRLVEDETANRLADSISAYRSMVNSRWFKTVPMILLLNKCDLLDEKLLQNRRFNEEFPEYTGENNFTECIAYIKRLFADTYTPSPNQERKTFYVHETVFTNRRETAELIKIVTNIVVAANTRGATV
ncbi:unnamed protein product [Caenorhabditis sp. 36 PRJEB53466]|nr:unnamed protein product [Caenorhabditis sp. 36 PRJEB53466]